MSLNVGDQIPDGTLTEYVEPGAQGDKSGPAPFSVAENAKGKKIALFAVPGAFTPTCSAKHVPGYLQMHDQLKEKGVDEIWCVAVNDPFVMGAWGREQGTQGKIRMLSDGSGTWTKKLGQEFDLSEKGLGVRSQRYSALLEDGVVKQVNVEQGGALEVSDATTLLNQL